MWGSAILLLCVLFLLVTRDQVNAVVAVIVLGCLFILLYADRTKAILAALAYLYLLGDFRRIVNMVAGMPSFDPLLLVGPIFVLILGLPLFIHLRLNDILSKAMLGVTVIMFLEIFNPKQGGIAVGMSGAIFYLIPVMWFWIGRRYGTTDLLEKLVYRVLIPLGIIAALLGLYQTYVGFLPWEQAWIDSIKGTYMALFVGSGVVRAFGYSVSSAEYTSLLLYSAVGSVAGIIGGRRTWILVLPILCVSLFLGSSRGPVFKCVITVLIIWTLRKCQPLTTVHIVRVVMLMVLGLGGTIFLASRFSGSGSAGGGNQAIEHQVGGLAHPLDPRYSTAQTHNKMILRGFAAGVTYPIGRGLGATTSAAAKFGSEGEELNSEFDVSDTFIILGAPGGILYIVIICSVFRCALAYIRVVPRHVGLPVLAILIAGFGAWLISGQYSTSAMLFFLIGAVVRGRNLALREINEPLRVLNSRVPALAS